MTARSAQARNRFAAAFMPVVAVAMLLAVALHGARGFGYGFGYDFYHLWGVALAHESVGGNPYADEARYSEVLNGVTQASPSTRLHIANRMRRAIEPTGTPLFYAAFAGLPRNFEQGYAAFVAALFVALLASAYALGRMRGVAPWTALALAAAIALTFDPLDQDVRSGNVNAFQLAFIVGAIAWARHRLERPPRLIDAAFLPALAVFVAFKPNTAPVALALALHFAVTAGARRTAAGLGAALAALVVAFAATALYFGDAGVWSDWYRYLHGMNGGTLLYSVAVGNESLAKMMAEHAGAAAPYAYGALLGIAFALLVAAGLSGFGKRLHGTREALRGALADPWCAASLGIVFAYATTPLLWPHYLLWSLVPMYWLFRREDRWDAPTVCVAVAYVALTTPVLVALYEAGQVAALHALIKLAWIPLAAAMCLALARPRRA